MLHPSYTDLMEVVNSEVEPGEQSVVQSRYSIVMSTAKRARQIVAGAEALVNDKGRDGKMKKPLSIAIEELYQSKVHILGDEEESLEEDAGQGSSGESEETSEDVSEDVSEEVTEEASGQTVEEAAGEATGEASEQTLEEVTEEAAEQTLEEVTEEDRSEEISEGVSGEAAEEADDAREVPAETSED